MGSIWCIWAYSTLSYLYAWGSLQKDIWIFGSLDANCMEF